MTTGRISFIKSLSYLSIHHKMVSSSLHSHLYLHITIYKLNHNIIFIYLYHISTPISLYL